MANAGLPHALASVEPLKHLLDDRSVIEILINPGLVWVERLGFSPEPTDLQLDEMQISGIIANLANISGREVDLLEGKGHLIISARLPGFRIEAQLPPLAVDGPYITIRRLNSRALSLDEYVQSGHLPEWVAQYLRNAVAQRQTILVIGGTSTGKTSFLSALIREIPDHEILLLIETIPEIATHQPFVRRLEADDEQGYPVSRLSKSALRSRPDRIFIGEVRGGEAFDFMDSANTGHPGSMGSLHANSPLDGLDRLENLILEGRPAMPLPSIKARIGQTFNLLVQMERKLIDGRYVRRISEVTRLLGYERGADVYTTETVFLQE